MVIDEAEIVLQQQFSDRERRKKVEAVLAAECKKEAINIRALQSGRRRLEVFQLRRHIAINLFDHYGIPLAEITQYTGVSTSAISKTESILIQLIQQP